MKVIVKGRHMNLTPALRAMAEEKLGQAIMKRFDRPAAKIEIELSDLGNQRDNNNKECRVTLYMPKGKTIIISEVDDDMYKAIDLAHDRLLTQVTRQRERRRKSTRSRKDAQKARETTARHELTSTPEAWEEEVQEYEKSASA